MSRDRPSLSFGALAVLGLCLLALGACEARVSLGGRCVYDSECAGLRCLYGRCRAECLTSVDCGGALECNAGVCARPDEACSDADPCASPELACAGSICATRCAADGSCAGDARCDETFAVPVCVPRLALDAGPRPDSAPEDDAGPPDASTPDAGAIDAPRPDASFAPGGVRDLCVSRYHACIARGADGIVQCWGTGLTGELGGGAPLAPGPGVVECTPFGAPPNLCSYDLVTVLTAGDVPLMNVVALTCGERTTLARTADGTLYSWGLGSSGELGRDFPGVISGDPYAAPVTDRAGTPLTDVEDAAMGVYHGCALRTGGTTWCWGAFYREPHGQLGTGATDPAAVEGAILATELGNALEVTVTEMSTCIVRSTGAVACVGLNEAGSAGESTSTSTSVRSAQTVGGIGPGGPSRLTSGAQFHCALDGSIPHCWGLAGQGSLGRGDVLGYETRCPDGMSLCDEVAAPTFGALRFADIASGAQASAVCGISDGRVHCWGGSTYGESGSTGRLMAPGGPIERADGGILADVRLVRVGGPTACALTTSDDLYCWGANEALHLRTPAPDTGTHAQAVLVPLD